MLLNFDLKNIVILLVAALNFATGLLIYLRNKKDATNISFFLLTLAIGFWGVSMFVFRSAISVDVAEFSARALYFWAALIPFFSIYFAYIFPEKEYRLNSWQKYFFPLPALLILLMCVLPGALIETVQFFEGRESVIVFNQFFHTLYVIYIIGYFNYVFLLLFRKYFKQTKGLLRVQIEYIIAGTLTTAFIGTITNLLGPYFGFFELNWFGQVGVIAMVSAIAYSIVRYNLFNLNLILVEIALILLNLILLVNIVFSKDLNIVLLNTLLSLSIFILSIFLIRGIYKDIRDREQIEKLVKEMEQANQRLVALEQQKTEFVSIASHQLRTPMTVIKGYASMVLEGAFGALPKEAKEAMGNLYKSSERIVALIEDLLTVSRIEQGRGLPIFQKINFTEFIRELIVSFTTDARVAGLKLAFTTTPGSEDVFVALDKKKFEQALRHIVGNAIKYTKTPGSISVAISNDTTTHKVFLSVSDTGIGMTEEQIKTLLEKGSEEQSVWGSFFGFPVPASKKQDRTDSSTQKTRGIGFYIAQELIEAHYGSIRIESEGPGRGTTVVVELPEMPDGDSK